MTSQNSIGDFMNANVERELRHEPILPFEHCEAFQVIADHIAAVERESAARVAVERAAQRKRRADELVDQGKFPARNVAAALEASDTSALRHGATYLSGRKSSVVFAGGVGCGKTTAATWVALEAGGSAPWFIRTSSLERRGRYDKNLTSQLESASMLVIDDVGAELLDAHGVFRSLFEEVIDTLHGDGKRLVMTTNLQESLFVERYGQRIASRLAESALWANCGMRDLRRDQLKLGEQL